MYDMMDAEYFVVSLYFTVIVIIMNYWLINLFVAVINEMFAKVREDSQHSAFTASRGKPVLADAAEGWSIGQGGSGKSGSKSRILANLVRYTKPFWVLLVAIDLIVMGLKNNDMTDEQLELIGKQWSLYGVFHCLSYAWMIVDTAELIFSIAFLIEIILRFFAEFPHWRKFFHSKTNRTDLLIAVITCIIRIPPIHDNRPVYAWLTGFQVLRIYRVVLSIPRIRTLSVREILRAWTMINDG